MRKLKVVSDGTVDRTNVFLDTGEEIGHVTEIHFDLNADKAEPPSVTIKFTDVELVIVTNPKKKL